MNLLIRSIFPLILLLAVAHAAPAQTLDTLKPGHPRVLAREADFIRIAELVESDPLAKSWHATMQGKAQRLLDQPVAKYELRDGRRLLYVSREVLNRVLTLAMLDRLEPDDRYRDRIWADLQAAADFKDWHPDHFLDVAEMALAYAIAYDWMYDRWTPAQRKTMRDALVRHALKPALKAHEQDVWWTRTHINWNQVCHGGLIAASLAIADDEPELSGKMIKLAVQALKAPMTRYAPDGGYEEGPGYWGYGTLYNVIAIAALESGLGTDFGLNAMPGFDKTGGFPKQMTGATGLIFNFGDNREKQFNSPALYWLARTFNQPSYAAFAASRSTGSAFDLLWYDPALIGPTQQPAQTQAIFQSAGVASMRSSWDPEAWYVGAKGGWIGFGHSQMDLGSFILEQGGQRWLIDLGSDDYNLSGYFSSSKTGKRWSYYRNRAEGHNTLVVNPDASPDQPYDATAPIQYADKTIAIDLSKVYGGDVKRTIQQVEANNIVRVIDRLSFDEPAEVWWFAHTRAEIELADAGKTAILHQGGKTMRVRLVSPKGARLTVMDARPLATSPSPKGQNPNNGSTLTNRVQGSNFVKRGSTPTFGEPVPGEVVRKLAIHLEGVRDEHIEVVFEPVDR